jgi:pilus assembly protein Flp/PilA
MAHHTQHDCGSSPSNADSISNAPQHRKMRSMRAFLSDESGATAIEYSIIASLIALVLITALSTIGNKLSTSFSEVSNNLK